MRAKRQQGVVLLEALVAILIFSIGILAIVGMQAAAVSSVTESRSRSEASFLANQLMTQIWTDARYAAAYAYPGSGTPPSRLAPWVTEVNQRLPGASLTPPIVTVTGATSSGAEIQIQVFWRLPEEVAAGAPPHNYIVRASVFTDN